jgi:hypothetical protein
MSTRSSAFALVCVLLSAEAADVARADDIFRLRPGPNAVVSCRFNGEARDCSRFQGYVIVRRRSETGAELATSSDNEPGRGDAALGAERVYLHVESQNAH